MKPLPALFVIGAVLASIESAHAQPARAETPSSRPSIPYVASRNDAVQDMLHMAGVGKDDVVCDLGSGDGRIAIAAVRDFGARRAIGVEIDPNRVEESRENARKAGVADRVEFIEGDLFEYDFREASVVTLFLGHAPNIKLRPMIFEMTRPGTKVVSSQFGMGEWQPDKEQTVRTAFLGMWGEIWNPFQDNPHVPAFTGNEGSYRSGNRIMMWVVPASLAGVWRGKIETTKGTQDVRLILHQRLSKINGTIHVVDAPDFSGPIGSDLWGSLFRFHCRPKGYVKGSSYLRFDGHVDGNTMRGTLGVGEPDGYQEYEWQAQRDEVDYSGVWEWTGPVDSRSVRLHIVRVHRRYVVKYHDGDRAVDVADFYDFGGGFYFTLLVGRDRFGGYGKEAGWLIGEAVLVDGELKGTLRFHPYHRTVDQESADRSLRSESEEWAPRLIKPDKVP